MYLPFFICPTIALPHLGHLNNLGYKVLAVGHRKNDNGFFNEQGIDYYSMDISKKEDFEKLPQSGIYAILNFAGALPASMQGYNPNSYINEFVKIHSIDIEREFFDFVREIVRNQGVVRFEEPLKNDNFRVGKQTTMAYVPN